MRKQTNQAVLVMQTRDDPNRLVEALHRLARLGARRAGSAEAQGVDGRVGFEYLGPGKSEQGLRVGSCARRVGEAARTAGGRAPTERREVFSTVPGASRARRVL